MFWKTKSISNNLRIDDGDLTKDKAPWALLLLGTGMVRIFCEYKNQEGGRENLGCRSTRRNLTLWTHSPKFNAECSVAPVCWFCDLCYGESDSVQQ